jgi:hypothetical protein
VLHFCTYFNRGYLPYGMALYRSLCAHAHDFRLYVVCFDDWTFDVLKNLDPGRICAIRIESVENADPALLAVKASRTPAEYFFTCTPSLPLYVMDHFDNVDMVTYLDSDLFFFGNPSSVYEELGSKSILIVGHRFPERLRHLERSGIYNVGLLVFRNDVNGRESLDWWRERCLEWCYERVEPNRFADQKYLDDWPTRFGGVVVSQNPGLGVGPWNVSRYRIQASSAEVLVDDRPLIFFHFTMLYRVTSRIYYLSLDEYDAVLSPVVKDRIYAPYIRHIESVAREFSTPSAQLRPGRHYGLKELY